MKYKKTYREKGRQAGKQIAGQERKRDSGGDGDKEM